jgi:hypothetical protein
MNYHETPRDSESETGRPGSQATEDGYQSRYMTGQVLHPNGGEIING